MTQLWRDVSNAAWKDPSLCVQDSTGYPTARSDNASNSTKAPPARTAQVPSLNYDLTSGNRVPVDFNSTDGLFDLKSFREAITACTTSADCSGNTPCSPIEINCGTPSHPLRKSARACTPKCQDVRGCTGENVECVAGRTLDSKGNSAFGISQKSSSSTSFNGVLREKLCTPLQDLRSLRLCG
jgi:hypothetical protein